MPLFSQKKKYSLFTRINLLWQYAAVLSSLCGVSCHSRNILLHNKSLHYKTLHLCHFYKKILQKYVYIGILILGGTINKYYTNLKLYWTIGFATQFHKYWITVFVTIFLFPKYLICYRLYDYKTSDRISKTFKWLYTMIPRSFRQF